ncbi:MAG TPA: NAD(P)/FAD-dependent oxidoreductase [Puia sp.]|nr:NAD(P)/FAD-dependent oxidoreductase [Puia sp.]
MTETQTIIVGASFSGLACAACLQKRGIPYLVLEKQDSVGAPWRRHYQRLHLHTNKRVSHLPYRKFGPGLPRYPARDQVVAYLEEYQKAFDIHPLFHTEAISIHRENGYWITETNQASFRSAWLVMATGPFGKPREPGFRGMESFPGRILHSSVYQTGSEYKGQRVLVVGFGNSACEIAIDLYEQGAHPSMSVRSPVNVIPRDLLGIPILEISQLLSRLPVKLADALGAPLMRMVFGDLGKIGLRKKPYGPFEEIKRDGTTPVLDIGTIAHIRKGHIALYAGIDHIVGNTVYFNDGKKQDFDTIVAGIGYDPYGPDILRVDRQRFDDLRLPIDRQQFFGKDGLYFCGFWVGPRGQIREIALDAGKIASDIAKKELHPAKHH